MLGDFRTRSTPSKANWILWWRVDEDDLRDQVAMYDTLGWFSAARKLSVVCLLISMALTLLVMLAGAIGLESYVDIALMVILAVFIYRGHRWAMIGAMALWTVEKIVTALLGLSGYKPLGAATIVSSLLWWAIYMHAFYLAFRVEQVKRKQAAAGMTIHDMTVWD